jgi:hypothetical protein
MQSHQAPLVWSLVLLIVIAGSCGTGNGNNANNVTVTISPATAMIAANGQVPLQAMVNNFCQTCTPEIVWSIAENSVTYCTWVDVNTPPSGPCPGGTIQGQGTQGPDSTTVIYFAPSTGGTFHVTASQLVAPSGNESGTSVITVSP